MRSTAPPRRHGEARLEMGRSERRAAVRYAIAMQLQFSVPGQPGDAPVGSYAGQLIDISREGMLLRSPVRLKVGQSLAGFIIWPAPRDDGVRLNLQWQGVVARVLYDRIALKISHFAFRPASGQQSLEAFQSRFARG